MSLLEKLPTELLVKISNLIATSGSKKLLGFTRASRRLHEIANPILYQKDVEESGGVVSIDHGLKTRLNSVIERCLAACAGAKASPRFRIDTLRIDSNEHLETYYNPELRSLLFQTDLPDDAGLHRTGTRVENRREAQSPASSQCPSDDVDKCLSPMAATKYTLRCHWSPLHVAAARDDVVLLRLLLDHSENANSPGIGVCPCYYRPLRRTIGRSVSEGHITTDHGFQEFLDRKLVTRWSPLHVAICNGHLRCAEMLINRFGLPHTEETAEEVAEQAQWFTKEIRHLESTGGIPRPSLYYFDDSILERWVDDYLGWYSRLTPRFDPSPPLHIAAEKYTSLGAIETVYLMLKKAGYFKDPQGIDVLDASGDTPFAVASFSGRAQTNGAWLRERGADINFRMRSNRLKSIFEALCECGWYQNAMVLMDMGVNVNSDELFRICSSYDPRYNTEEAMILINRLIDEGLDINAKSKTRSHAAGYTALMAAVVRPFPAATRMLIHAGADVHAMNNSGKTALHMAVKHCLQESPRRNNDRFAIYFASIQLLLDHGADPNHHSHGVPRPLYAGEYGGKWRNKSCGRFDFCAFAEFGRGFNSMASIAPLMIRRGANPNIRLKHPGRGNSLAVTAFYLGEFDSLDALSTHGAVITRDEYLDMMRDLIHCPPGKHRLSPVDPLFRMLNRQSVMLPKPEDRNYIMNAWEEVLYHAVGRRPSFVHDLAKHITLTDLRGLGGKNVLHIMARWERRYAMRPAKFKCRIERVMADLMHCGAYRMIHETDDYGKSPLQTAVDLGNTPVAISLVGYGADCHTETENHDGTMTVSPLRSAIRKYAKVCFYNMAFEMLAAADQAGLSINVRKTRCFHDFVLHLGDAFFDEPSQAIARTTGLMRKLVSLGAGVDETDGEGNTPLHLLLHLLEAPGETTISHSSGGPGNTVKMSNHSGISFGTNTPRLFELWDEEGIRWVGQSIFDSESGGEYFADSTDDDEPGEGTSHTCGDAGKASPSTQTHPADQTREGAGDEPRLADNRSVAWISAFIFLLTQGASLTVGNNAGKTALDYIDDFRRRPPHNCPDFYSSVIGYLNDSVKRPPFDPKLRVHFDGSSVAIQGNPALFLHAPRHQLGADKDRPVYTLQSCAREESFWLAFW